MKLLFAEELKLIEKPFEHLYFYAYYDKVLAICVKCEDKPILRNGVEMLIYESQHTHA